MHLSAGQSGRITLRAPSGALLALLALLAPEPLMHLSADQSG